MNSTPATPSDLEIVKSILAEADAEVARILDAAHTEARAEEDRLRNEAEAAAAEIRAQADQTAARHRTREMATAAVEVRRMLLWAREKRVAAALTRVEESLRALRDDPERYRLSLIALAAEAVFATGGDPVRLQFAARDRAMADEALVAAVKDGVRARGGGDVGIEVEFPPDSIDAGCIASVLDGRIVYDNTFQRRLERERRALRREILKEIEQSHG